MRPSPRPIVRWRLRLAPTSNSRSCAARLAPRLSRLIARFATNTVRVLHREDLKAQRELERKPAVHWEKQLSELGVPCGTVNDVAAAIRLAEQLGLAPVQVLTRADGSTIKTIANPILLSDTPVRYTQAPPRMGQHSDELRRLLQASANLLDDAPAVQAHTSR